MSEHQVWIGNMCFARLVTISEMNGTACVYVGSKRVQLMDAIREVDVYDTGNEYICVCSDVDKEIRRM